MKSELDKKENAKITSGVETLGGLWFVFKWT